MVEQYSFYSFNEELLNYPVKPTISIIKVANGVVSEDVIKHLLDIGTTWFYFWGDYAVKSENLADTIVVDLDMPEVVTISNPTNSKRAVKKNVSCFQLDDMRHLFIDSVD